VVNPTPRPLLPRKRDSVFVLQEAEWAPGQVWRSAENLASNGIRSPDRHTAPRCYMGYAFPAHIFAAHPFRTTDLHYFLLVQTTEMTDTKELCSEFP